MNKKINHKEKKGRGGMAEGEKCEWMQKDEQTYYTGCGDSWVELNI